MPPGPLRRTQRPPQTPSKEAAGGGEREEAEQKALLAVQCSLLKILSKTLATLQHFTPDCCQILLDQVCTLTKSCYHRWVTYISGHKNDDEREREENNVEKIGGEGRTGWDNGKETSHMRRERKGSVREDLSSYMWNSLAIHQGNHQVQYYVCVRDLSLSHLCD